MNAIHTDQLTKQYGKYRGIERLDLEVRQGEVFGFLGPNGAGKTTTIRLLLDLIRPTSGRARVLGEEAANNPGLRRRVGYLPGELNLYDGLSGRELFAYFARLRGRADPTLRDALTERLGLDPSRPMRTLSKGNKQKIGLVLALMGRPELLILDEPTSGLDPLLQQEFQGMVREAVAGGATVFLSSHLMGEVQALCGRVGIIREGRLAAVETVSELHQRALRRVRLRFGSEVSAGAWEGVPGLREVRAEGASLEATVQGSLDPLIKRLAAFEVLDFISEEPSLEETFLAYYSDRAA